MMQFWSSGGDRPVCEGELSARFSIMLEAITDLPAYDYTFPTCITPTGLRPDAVLWSPTQKSTILVELTVCHETNFEDAKSKYKDLVETNGFDTSTVILGGLEGFKHLFSSLKSSKNRHHFLQDVSRKAILGSHRIWTLRKLFNVYHILPSILEKLLG